MRKLETREDFTELLSDILAPLKPFYTDARGRIKLSGAGALYCQDSVEMEAFARPLWGLSALWKNGDRLAPFEEWYRKGLVSGSDPSSPEYWGEGGDEDQRYVEMAPIAFALMTSPDVLWDPLTDAEKHTVATYLYKINNHEMPKCNWYFFRILVNTALKRLGMPYSEKRLKDDESFIESCYLGNGWYNDGYSGRTDYYIAFAMHFYSLIWSMYIDDEKKKKIIMERAERFAEDFIYWFSSSGESIAYGRSLTYRFAQCSFWSAYAAAGGKNIAIAKGIIVRHMEAWLKNGIFDNSGILTVGYCYPNLSMADNYNAPGSPYWALKAFAVLLMDENDNFWKTETAPLPHLDNIHAIPEAKMLMQHRGWESVSFVPGMLGMGSLGYFSDKYDKFAYSSSFAFSVAHTSETLEEAAPDSMLCFIVDGVVRVRRGSESYRIDGNSLISEWSPCSGIKVITEITVHGNCHERKHTIVSSIGCVAYDSGFSVPDPRSEERIQKRTDSVSIMSGGYVSGASCMSGNGMPVVVIPYPNTNLRWRNTVFPSIKIEIMPDTTTVVVDRFYTEKEDKDD